MRSEFAAAGLWLRPFVSGDAAVLTDVWSAPEMDRQFPFPVTDLVAAAQLIGRWGESAALDTQFVFAVTEADTVLGQVSVGIDRSNSEGWVSYWTTPAARGRGVAARGCAALARWCFEDAELFRLELGHRVNNPASCRVALAAGFRVEGLQRGKLLYDDKRFDVELHARLATD